jgi:hypothetical protein
MYRVLCLGGCGKEPAVPTSVLIHAGEVVAFLLAAGAVTLAVGLWWVKRRVRRLRLALAALARVTPVGAASFRHQAMAARARAAAVSAASAGRRRAWAVPLPDRRWLAAARERRKLWRAVGAAEHAVAVARQSGAPTGDLDALCRRLGQAAAEADRGLSLSPAASASVSEVVAAAGVIAETAASAAAAVTWPAHRRLADDVRREAEALAAGIAAVSPGRLENRG